MASFRFEPIFIPLPSSSPIRFLSLSLSSLRQSFTPLPPIENWLRNRRNRYGRYSSYPTAGSIGLPLKIFPIDRFRFSTKTKPQQSVFTSGYIHLLNQWKVERHKIQLAIEYSKTRSNKKKIFLFNLRSEGI